jgi:iron complex outermembrane recepter protein
MDRRIQWNGAIYQEDWNHARIPIYGLGVISVGAILNGGNYRVRGVETSGVARVATGLTIEAGAAWNHSELVKQATFFWVDGAPIDFTTLRSPTGQTFPNPGGTLGIPLAGAPPFQGNIRARYEFPFNGYEAFAQIDAVHKSDAWLVQVYGENLTDTHAQLYANYTQWYKAVTVSRPRTIGLRFSYKFSGR